MNEPGPKTALTRGGFRMNRHLVLVITSALSVLLMTVHLTQDAVHAKVGNPEAGGSTLVAVPILVVWLYGTLLLGERRSGYIVMLVGSLIALGMPIIHTRPATGFFTGQIANRPDAFWFVWTLHALGVAGLFSLILAIQGLLTWRRDHARP